MERSQLLLAIAESLSLLAGSWCSSRDAECLSSVAGDRPPQGATAALQLWLPGRHTSALEVLPRQRSHRQSPPPGTYSPFRSLVVNRGQGLLKVEQGEHPRVLAQMFLAGCTDLQVGAPRTGGFGTKETITNLLTEKVNRDESLWI